MDNDELYQKLLTKAIMFLGYKPRTRKEILLRLDKYLKVYKEISEDVKKVAIQKVIDYLQENKLIDDAEFIRLFIDAKFDRKKAFGKNIIEEKLVAKGINRADAREYIDDSISEEDELKVAVSLLERKFGIVFATPTSVDVKARMGKFLVARGFSYSIAKTAVDYLVKRP